MRYFGVWFGLCLANAIYNKFCGGNVDAIDRAVCYAVALAAIALSKTGA